MQHNWIILKFGGSSVAEPAHWQTIYKVVKARFEAGMRPVLVLSALKNVSNALEALLHQSLAGVHLQAIAQLKELHTGFASQLGLDTHDRLNPWFEKLARSCHQIHEKGEISPRLHARVLAIGELLSTSIGALYLERKLSEDGITVHWTDARKLLTSRDHGDPWHHFTAARCDFGKDPLLENQLQSQAGLLVTQGFIASDDQGQTVLLGREGSDTSAAYLGAKLNARRIEIWTDVPGIFSANPQQVFSAIQRPLVSYSQAELMAKAGAKVLHPGALKPAQKTQIPMEVRSTRSPNLKGTQIGVEQSEHDQVLAIALTGNICLIRFNLSSEAAVNQTLENAMPLGYDPLFAFTKQHLRYLTLIYSNSDREQPDEDELHALLNNSELTIKTGLSQVAVIGQPHSQDWINHAIQFTENQFGNKQLFHFFDLETGLACFLVKPEKAEDLMRHLHHELIEKSAPVGAKSWLDMQSS